MNPAALTTVVTLSHGATSSSDSNDIGTLGWEETDISSRLTPERVRRQSMLQSQDIITGLPSAAICGISFESAPRACTSLFCSVARSVSKCLPLRC
jgi:hypothetical protein